MAEVWIERGMIYIYELILAFNVVYVTILKTNNISIHISEVNIVSRVGFYVFFLGII